MKLAAKIHRFFIRVRLHPIRVFCMHHVCEQYNPDSMCAGDWMALEDFQKKCRNLKEEGYEFISLSDAYCHIKHDLVRHKKYVVITFDDGYASLKEVLPWLEEQKIPCTLFINGKYTDGVSFRKKPTERYLTRDEVFEITCPLVEIGSHGWEHTDATKMEPKEFAEALNDNVKLLGDHSQWTAFHAYTWGRHNIQTDNILRERNIIPVLVDGMKNYDDKNFIHRELFDPK